MKKESTNSQLTALQITLENINDKLREMVKLMRDIKRLQKENAIVEDKFLIITDNLSAEDYD